MIPIKTYKIKDQNLKNHLERIGDLINMEGPMLSLFIDNRNHDLYLFDWADSDNKTNRWLIYKISSKALSGFILKNISFKEMFLSQKDYFVTEIKEEENPPFEIYGIENLPKEYYPTDNLFFDESDARGFSKIKSLLDNLSHNLKWEAIISPDEFHNQNLKTLKEISSNSKDLIFRSFQYNIGTDIPKGKNDIKNDFHLSNLAPQDDNKPNRFFKETRMGLLAR